MHIVYVKKPKRFCCFFLLVLDFYFSLHDMQQTTKNFTLFSACSNRSVYALHTEEKIRHNFIATSLKAEKEHTICDEPKEKYSGDSDR